MAITDQFASALSQMDTFLVKANAINSSLINSKQREIFGQALAMAKKARVEMETAVPAALQAIEQTKQKATNDLASLRAGVPALKQKQQEMKQTAQQASAKMKEAKAKMKKAPVKASMKGIKMPPAWGDQLKDELLNKFGNLPSAPTAAPRDAAIWDDWQWGAGEKPMGEG
ncbi:hypothetical protein M4951_25275 [Blastopirellula sp. J2-11]|uniref:hypothetical protein n=1 Tax=Blastopirellula sp. J2-11 TaxID=2943192 RepID=UPI0021C84140|nr:hypothetical protein [Blastopirellula sp. J2-11]UUO06642.1 hypothetical protein M4951_25275 [Blastopirellula sp. J2-11]